MLAGSAVDYSLFIINYCIIEEVLWSKIVERCGVGDADSELSHSNHDVNKASEQPFLSLSRTRQ